MKEESLFSVEGTYKHGALNAIVRWSHNNTHLIRMTNAKLNKKQ